jgi:hypothetical protein
MCSRWKESAEELIARALYGSLAGAIYYIWLIASTLLGSAANDVNEIHSLLAYTYVRTAFYIIKQRAELRLFHFPIFHFFFGLIIIIILLFCHFKLNQKCGGLDRVQSPRWFWQIVDLFDTSTFLFILPILYNKYAHRLMGSSVSEILIRSCLFISLPLHNSRSPNRENL